MNVIRLASEKRLKEGQVLVKLDFSNAHSEVSRASVLEQLSDIPSLQHLAQHMAISLAAPTTLLSNGKRWGEAGDGMIQGSAGAGCGFNVSIQPDLVELDRELAEHNGLARAGQDDVFAIGPPNVI